MIEGGMIKILCSFLESKKNNLPKIRTSWNDYDFLRKDGIKRHEQDKQDAAH